MLSHSRGLGDAVNIPDHRHQSDEMRQIDHQLESPRPNETVYDQCISIAGTISAPENGGPRRLVRAWIDDVCIGETRIFRQISAVEKKLGYKILAKVPEPITAPRPATIAITLSVDDREDAEKSGEVTVQLVPARLHERGYGDVVSPNQAKMLHRQDIYGSGRPAEQPSPEALGLVLDYLPPRSSIVDVGCGAGAYGPELIQAGHQWLGLEVNDLCIRILERRKLPYRKPPDAGSPFPCADREFDHAICIEVLEHIENPDFFLTEIGRIIRGRALFSVPNLEVLPYLEEWGVVPWHMLEADHRNFFTRSSLRELLGKHFADVEVFSYGEHRLRTREDVAFHCHLFAVAAS